MSLAVVEQQRVALVAAVARDGERGRVETSREQNDRFHSCIARSRCATFPAHRPTAPCAAVVGPHLQLVLEDPLGERAPGDLDLAGLDVDADDLVGTDHAGALDHVEPDPAEAEHHHVRARPYLAV